MAYVLYGESGEYSDATWWLVSVHESAEAARARADSCKAWIDEQNAIDLLNENNQAHESWTDMHEDDYTRPRLHPPEDPNCCPRGEVTYTVVEMELQP